MAEAATIGIDNELKEKKEELERIKRKIDEENQRQQYIKQYVTDLEKVNAELKLSDTSYDKVFTEKASLDKYAGKKAIDDAAKELLQQIEEIKSRLNEAAGYPDKQVQDLTSKRDSLAKEVESAKTEALRAQQDYERLKGKQKDVDTALKLIRDLKTSVDRDQQDAIPAAYYALQRMRKALEELRLEDPSKYTEDLENAGKALAGANKDLRIKTASLEKLKTELDEATKREAKYREDVMAELRNLKPKAQAKHQALGKQQAPARQQAQTGPGAS